MTLEIKKAVYINICTTTMVTGSRKNSSAAPATQGIFTGGQLPIGISNHNSITLVVKVLYYIFFSLIVIIVQAQP